MKNSRLVKTLQAVEDAQVVILVIDAQEGLVEQDLHLIGMVVDAGRALVVAINKWDHLLPDDRDRVRVRSGPSVEFHTLGETNTLFQLCMELGSEICIGRSEMLMGLQPQNLLLTL